MGSSIVIILVSLTRSFLVIAFTVVVFPEPVGPVTRINPCGVSSIFSISVRHSSVNPRSSKFNLFSFFPSILRTIDSPYFIGTIETRRSVFSFPSVTLILPSCGILFSSMFRFDIIFIRELIESNLSFSTVILSSSDPSILYRILTLSFMASM